MSLTNTNKSWFSASRFKAQARLRLFCFPYAGGGASIFRAWAEKLPAEIDCCAIQLPGRENRLSETPVRRLDLLLEQLVPALLPSLDRPYAFFGHSMGALICFELTHELIRLGYRSPVRLLVSSHRAPHLPPTKPPTYHLPEDEFIEEVRCLQGTPEEVLQHEELLQLMLPLLRADFELCETYHYTERGRLNIPITSFGGLEDRDIPRISLEAWKEHTTREYIPHFFRGGHFFLHSEQETLLQVIAKDLLLKTGIK